MRNEIKQMVETCPECVRMLPSQSAEEQIQTVTSTPMEAISVDLGERGGVHYLIGADRYSGWPFVTKLSSLVTKAITNALDSWFLEHGRPQRIRSDGGPQFREEFKNGASAGTSYMSNPLLTIMSQMVMPKLPFAR